MCWIEPIRNQVLLIESQIHMNLKIQIKLIYEFKNPKQNKTHFIIQPIKYLDFINLLLKNNKYINLELIITGTLTKNGN